MRDKGEARDGARDGATDAGRRGLLKCMAWAGTGLVWTWPAACLVARCWDRAADGQAASGFSFVQISDSHIGFNKPANPDARATFREAVAKIAPLPAKPDFMIHTGDISQLSQATSEFDDADQILKERRAAGLPRAGRARRARRRPRARRSSPATARGRKGAGWYSFDHKGVHFVALVNVLNLKAGGLGILGADQIAWLKEDLTGRAAIDADRGLRPHPAVGGLRRTGAGAPTTRAQALELLKRFGSVTVLNGHIHQVQQKVEGNIAFHTARSTAFPQPAPGTAASPGPMKVPADKLRSMLGAEVGDRHVEARRRSRRRQHARRLNQETIDDFLPRVRARLPRAQPFGVRRRWRPPC